MCLSIASFAQLRKDQLGAINTRDIKCCGAVSSLKLGKLNDSTYLSFLGVKNDLSDLNSASAARTNLGLGSFATISSLAFSSLTGIPTTLSGYGITDAQPLNPNLTTIAGLTPTTNNFIVSVGSAWASRTPSQVKTTLAISSSDVSGLGPLATLTPGTGVQTALGVNVGSAGAPVVNGGALGTPSSGTLTNATGLPASSIVAGALANGMTATTQSVTDNSKKIATTEYVTSYVASTMGSVTNTTVSGATTLTTSNFGQMIFVSGGGYTITLPTAVGNTGGLIYFQFTNSVSSLITLDPNGSETIDGSLTQLFWAKESCVIISDGSNWNFNYVKRIPMSAGLYSNADQTSIPTSTLTKVATNTLIYDNYGSLASTVNQKITIARTGRYRVVGNVWFLNPGTSARNACAIYINGVVVIPHQSTESSNGATSASSTAWINYDFDLNTGDYLEFYGTHAASSNNGTFKVNSGFTIREIF